MQHGAAGVEHLDGVVDELGAFAADAEGPSVFSQTRFVEFGFFLGGGGGPEEGAEGADEGEVDFGAKYQKDWRCSGLRRLTKSMAEMSRILAALRHMKKP
jgi:hypothetical protein